MEFASWRTFLVKVLDNIPEDWIKLTTHRLDIYNEEKAKTEFLNAFEKLYQKNDSSLPLLQDLPTAFDYIRLGHPLSCILEWAMSKILHIDSESVISFSSSTMPILAILRKNKLLNQKTLITYKDSLPQHFNPDLLQNVYGYNFELRQIEQVDELTPFDGSIVHFTVNNDLTNLSLFPDVDFLVNSLSKLGSVIVVNGNKNKNYISEIQHVRRRESIAMTPSNCRIALKNLVNNAVDLPVKDVSQKKNKVVNTIHQITGASTRVVLGSSGLSIQYAVVMGLIDNALQQYPGHPIKILLPPNCYGGTNDQARRVAACLKSVEVLDLPVDRDHDMVASVDMLLDKAAQENAVPLIIVEIPTNPRVEIPDLEGLQQVLCKKRSTPAHQPAIEPVFIIDQTFCPNVHFLGDNDILSEVRTLSYVSGSKFPSGGLCTAGYCLSNKKAETLIPSIETHLKLCDNEATDLQIEILSDQLPSMNQRISQAYHNTREFVSFIQHQLPQAKINFVSDDLARQGFTPSVFSLDLPTKGNSPEERESYKRSLNHILIDMMIKDIPDESKYCVSYGQLKGCYWTIPATSTQGTTKEADKDYIVRVSCAPNMDLKQHKNVFLKFIEEAIN